MRIPALIVATATLVAAPVAIAATKDQGIDASVTSSKAGTAKKPRNVGINVVLTTPAPPAGKQFATQRAVLSLPKGLKFNGAKFPECTAAKLQSGGGAACPAGSKVGSGSANAVALNGKINAALTVTAYNAAKGKKLLLHVQGSQPIQINSILEGTLKTKSSGATLDVPIPANLKSIAGAQPTLTRFATKIQATRKGVGYVQSTSCPAGGWKFGANLSFTDGDTGADTDTVACKK